MAASISRPTARGSRNCSKARTWTSARPMPRARDSSPAPTAVLTKACASISIMGCSTNSFRWTSSAAPTCAGVFGYLIGDTVRLVDKSPPRLLVTGRTSYGLSAFGEHLIAEEIESAVAAAASAIGADVTDYSVGAVFPHEGQPRGGHLYVVEFAGGAPDQEALKRFGEVLDATLLRLNDDYRAHRAGEFGMRPPEVRAVGPGAFARWMKSRGKLGGQHKVPRVINDRELWNDLLRFVSTAGATTACRTEK